MFIFPPEQLPYYQNYAFREKFFSPEECDKVLALLNQFPLADAVMRRDDGLGNTTDIRKSRAAVVPWIKDAEWVYNRLGGAVLECNKAIYNFQLTGFLEGVQLSQYQAGSFFDWHEDFGYRERSVRKLNVLVQLGDPAQYEGGDVEFFSGRAPQKAVRTRGALLLFPSFVPYRITPITSGTRHALDGWVSGPPFR